MTMGWHMIMEFEPSLVGCYIWSENHSFDMVRNSKECVVNIPTVDLATKVVERGFERHVQWSVAGEQLFGRRCLRPRR